MKASLRILSSIPLINVCGFMPVPHFFITIVLLCYFESGMVILPALFLLFRIVLSVLCFVFFVCILRLVFAISVKNCVDSLMVIVLNL